MGKERKWKGESERKGEGRERKGRERREGRQESWYPHFLDESYAPGANTAQYHTLRFKNKIAMAKKYDARITQWAQDVGSTSFLG